MYETILYDKKGGIAEIALNRPEVLNAFDTSLHGEIRAAFSDVDADEEVRAVLLRGEGRGFSAGADLGEIVANDDKPDLGAYLRQTYSPLVKRIVGMGKPVIAVLHGPVYGAGLGISLACDLRVASEDARFSAAFVKIGLMPDAGITHFLPRLIGLGRAMEMSMLGEEVDAAEALRIGLVNCVASDGEAEARSLAGRLAAMPTRALAEMKEVLSTSFDRDLSVSLEREATGQTACGYTADHQEGVSAFFDKREPTFIGE